MANESNVTVLNLRANSLTPDLSLETVAGVRGDDDGAFGISFSDLPIGMLDIYRRCNSTSSERFMTSCPDGYNIVDKCSDSSSGLRECVLVSEGTHRLVLTAGIPDDDACYSEESDRSPYAKSVPSASYACDAFSPLEIPAAVRGDSPKNGCCEEYESNTFDFCIKPCGCRTLKIEFVPKAMIDGGGDDQASPVPAANVSPSTPGGTIAGLFGLFGSQTDTLRLAVVSNVEANDGAFAKFIESVRSKNVDVVVNIGNLTDGGSSTYRKYYDIIRDRLTFIDGAMYGYMSELWEAAQSKYDMTGYPVPNSSCGVTDGAVCCDDSAQKGTGRIYESCNTVLYRKPFISGLGDLEIGSLSAHRKYFGPSNLVTTIGRVQLIMLDTADAGMSSLSREWLKNEILPHSQGECRIDPPSSAGLAEWPLLSECRDMLGLPDNSSVSCLECIGRNSYCIPPDASRSDNLLGPENCICVPASSEICQGTMSCPMYDGAEHECVCTRDADCGVGGRCESGACVPPFKIVFSYTPIFDSSGPRNNAFVSKTEAAGLLSLLVRAGVGMIFSGRAADYSAYSKAGIPMYITGGGGAPMASFSQYGHHWLMVDIPGGYTVPDAEAVKVTVMEF